MRFVPGQFLGAFERQRTAHGLALADLRPTVPEHQVHTHTHDDAHFLLLLAGRYVSSARGMPEVRDRPALVLNPPGTTHRDRFRGLDGRFFTLSVPTASWRSAMHEHALPDHAVKLGTVALLAAHRLCDELRDWDGASALVVESEYHLLLAEAARDARERLASGPAWLARAREQLQDTRDVTPRLSELAAAADVHPVHFSRAFRARYGRSPGEYLRHCRLERACALLHDPRRSLAEIAAQCGYVDQSHFSHAFRRAYRLTPTAFRRLVGRA
ncbi:helix-turn-helix transcriptional regulator [Nannocystis sp. SCPEA4]|uniref:helix-turn-helix transcriptional regulator n=1 Tax=Nannocystis sp. SCPEA4 TaxID=2996787 RepID=UPI00226D5C97|nr:helix-turn-helix transcriptional regulator [Nannocystis sp. SCPEA4]MCY1059105.1 helix-turn-helix transcriptional regulator [Nannocystis sp. SCPEA4]